MPKRLKKVIDAPYAMKNQRRMLSYILKHWMIFWRITVDHALISDEEQHKKSDFLLWTFNSGNTHIIELKGKNVDAAFEQIATTIQALGKDDGTKELVAGRNILDAYIASPNKQNIPEIHSGKRRSWLDC